MLDTLKRFALGAIGALGLLAAIVKQGRKKAPPDALRLLRHLAKSSPVPELSNRLKLRADDTAQLLTELEQRGWIQLSADQSAEHVRIAALRSRDRALTCVSKLIRERKGRHLGDL